MTPLLELHLEHQAGALALRAKFTILAEHTALFGPSGAGKSTLLRILAGLERPARGSILLEGRCLLDRRLRVDVPPARRGLGLVTQANTLFPHLSIEGNLLFGLRGLAAATQRERVEEAAATLRLEALMHRKPPHLSGGEQQRVALARTLVRRPRMLLLDEPFSALDGAGKAALWAALMPLLKAHRIATLLVSHDAGEVWSRSESVVRMEGATATEQGTPAAMLAREKAAVLEQFGASTS